MLLASLLLAAAPPAQGCAIAASAKADGSFAQAGYEASPERLNRLAEQTRLRFAAAARRMCAAGLLRPADLARFRTLIVQNGEGATEPVIYREAGMKAGTWVFQFAFQDGEAPKPAAFEQALRCWKHPDWPDCDDGD